MAWHIGFDYVSAQPDFVIDPLEDGTTPWGFGWSWGTGHSLRYPAPRSATQTDNHKLVDVFPMPGAACVSDRFRQVVEAFEPGVHEFHPIQLRSRKGVPYEERYFLINVRQRFDCILVRGAAVDWREKLAGGLEGMPYLSHRSGRPPLTASRAAIAGRHLWLNYWLQEGGGVMISDALRSALMGARIRRMTFKEPWAEHFEEVDTPFDYREQTPNVIQWMEDNRPDILFEQHLDWVKGHMPHWLQ